MISEKEKTEKPESIESNLVFYPAADLAKRIIFSNGNAIGTADSETLSEIAINHDVYKMQVDSLSKDLKELNSEIAGFRTQLLQNKMLSYQEKIDMLLDIIHFMTVKPGVKDDRKVPA